MKARRFIRPKRTCPCGPAKTGADQNQSRRIREARPLAVRPQGRGLFGFVKHLRHRLHLRGIDFFQPVHMDQNLVQIGLEFLNLVIAEFQIGQLGYVADFLLRDLQASSFLRDAL